MLRDPSREAEPECETRPFPGRAGSDPRGPALPGVPVAGRTVQPQVGTQRPEGICGGGSCASSRAHRPSTSHSSPVPVATAGADVPPAHWGRRVCRGGFHPGWGCRGRGCPRHPGLSSAFPFPRLPAVRSAPGAGVGRQPGEQPRSVDAAHVLPQAGTAAPGSGTREQAPPLQNQTFWWEKALPGRQTRLCSCVQIPTCSCKPELGSSLFELGGGC